MLLMQDGGPIIHNISVNNVYRKLMGFLQNSVGIDCESYTVTLPVENIYHSVYRVYTRLCELNGEKNIDKNLFLQACCAEYPCINVEAIMQGWYFDFSDVDFAAKISYWHNNRTGSSDYDFNKLINSCLGGTACKALGNSFTLKDFLLAAQAGWQEFALPHYCRVDNIFAYFNNGTDSLTQRLMQFAVDTNGDKEIDSPNSMVANLISMSDLQAFSLPEELSILYQVTQGVSYLHAKGVAHNDMHTGNILLDTDGVVRLIDFDRAIDSTLDGSEAELLRGSDYDLAVLRGMMDDIISSKSQQFDLDPQSQNDLSRFVQLAASFKTAQELLTGLASFQHLLPPGVTKSA